MTDEELRKLKRGDLLELLVAQSRETEELREKLQTAEQELASRRIRLNEVGNIANAALDLNGVFAAAQAAADQYVESIRLQSQDTESHCAQLVAEAQEKADRLLAETETKCAATPGTPAAGGTPLRSLRPRRSRPMSRLPGIPRPEIRPPICPRRVCSGGRCPCWL